MQTNKIEYKGVPTLTYYPLTVQAPNQPIQTDEIEYNRIPTLTNNQLAVQVANQP